MTDFTIHPGISADIGSIYKCDNCCCSLLNDNLENEGIEKLKIKSRFSEDISEIQIWNALEFIYGVSWKSCQNYNLEKNSPILNSPDNIKLCNNCASLLSENYNAHQNFENACHPSSPVELLKEFRSKRINLPQGGPQDYELPTENDTDTEKNVKEELFNDFTFENDEDDHLNLSQEAEETKYEPLPTMLSQDNTSPYKSESLETTSSRRTSLRTRQLVIKAEKLSHEEILQLTAKKGSKKIRRRKKKLTSVKKSYEKRNKIKETGDDDFSKKRPHHVEKPTRKIKIEKITTKIRNTRREKSIRTKPVKDDIEQPHEAEKSITKTEKITSKTANPSRKKLTEAQIQERISEILKNIEDKTKFRSISVAGRYVCIACGKTFKKLETLKYTHWKREHEGNVCVCDICGKVLKSPRIMRWHNLRVHGTEEEKNKWKIPCEICNVLVYKYEMKLHMSQSHPEGPRVKFKCEQCDKEFTTKKQLSDHLLIHVEEPQKCDVCSKVFLSSIRLNSHKATVHSTTRVKTISCEKCPMKFSNKTRLRLHLLTHEETRQYICEECGKSFKYSFQLGQHLKCHQDIQAKGEGAFTCDICNDGKTFKHSLSLSKHKYRLHTQARNNPKIYQCSFCGKRLCSSTNLRIHENMHKELPGFKPRIRQKLPGHIIYSSSGEGSDPPTSSVTENVLAI